MTPDERAAVAREALTEMAQRFREDPLRTLGETGAQVVEAHRDEHYPAPAAPVTLTVEGYSVSPVVRENGLWRDADGCAWHDYDSIGCAPLFARIASDARRIEALEAANASLKAEIDRISAMRQDALDELVRVGSERDEARRKLDAIQTPPSCSKMTSQGEGQQERLAAVAPSPASAEDKQGSPPAPVVPSPAPIPLGAKMQIGDTEWTRVERGWDDGIAWYSASFHVGQLATAHYRALHPVADAATVKRVAQAIFRDRWRGDKGMRDGVRDTYCNDAHAALRALGYTIQEGANG